MNGPKMGKFTMRNQRFSDENYNRHNGASFSDAEALLRYNKLFESFINEDQNAGNNTSSSEVVISLHKKIKLNLTVPELAYLFRAKKSLAGIFQILFASILFFTCGELVGQQVRLGLPTGHTNYISSAKWSPDGSKILTSSFDKSLIIWDAESGASLYSLNAHQGLVVVAEWSPDGKKIASGSMDNTAIIWDAPTGKPLFTLFGHTDGIKAVSFSPDGKKLVTASEDHTAKIWDVESGRLIHSLEGCRSWVVSARWSPDGKYIVTASQDSTARIWNARSGKLTRVLTGHRGYVSSAVFSPDGRKVLTSSWDMEAWVWDANTGYVLMQLKGHRKAVHSAVFSPDGNRILTGSKDSTARVWDGFSGKPILTLRSGIGLGNHAAYSPDGTFICFGTTLFNAGNGTKKCELEGENESSDQNIFSPDSRGLVSYFSNLVSIRNTRSGIESHLLGGHLSGIRTSCFSPDSRSILISHFWAKGAKIFRYGGPDFEQSLMGHTNPVESAVFSADGKHILTSSLDCKAIVWDGTTGNLQKTLKGGNKTNLYFAVCDSSCNHVMAGAWDKTILWSLGTKDSVIELTEQKQKVDFGAFSPDGKYCLSVMGDQLSVWRTYDPKKLYAVRGGISIYYAVFSPDSRYILYDGAALGGLLINTANGKRVARYYDQAGRVVKAAFSPDGEFIVAALNNTEAVIWRVFNGAEYMRLVGHTLSLNDAAFSPDGRWVVTASNDFTARVWNVGTGQNELVLMGHSAPVITCCFSPDGKFIMTRSADGSIILWDASTGKNLVQQFMFDEEEWLALTPDKYYFGSKNGIALLHWITDDGNVYSFEQFDLQYNRPDLVLERIGIADTAVIRAFRNAYRKRLKKMNFEESMFSPDFHMPRTIILNKDEIPVNSDKEKITLELNASDTKYSLDRINVWVNDIPLMGMNGIDLRKQNSGKVTSKIDIPLAEGKNKIQVSCLNEKGVESLKETVMITFEPRDSIVPRVHLAIIGVSEYQDSGFMLKYAVKDGRDMARLFANKGVTDIDTLFNRRATRENILALKQNLQKTSVDDIVILYVSGHGLLDENYNFYFATWDMNFNKPAEHGLLYDDLEGLLDSIPARKKLLLMDACHSGEVDRDDLTTDSSASPLAEAGGEVKKYNTKGVAITSQDNRPQLGLQNTFELMTELFINLSRGSGAVVISAASGTGFALESPEWNNGVFTWCILNGLKNQAADKNGDKKIMVSELKAYVSAEVERLTRGAQKPTSRRENLENDWRVW